MRGLLIAFEGLDQSGKQTQAALLRERLTADGLGVRLLSFPDYGTAIGAEIGRALRGERAYGPDVMQLLYIANRYEWKPEIVRARDEGTIVVCDRYLASSVAYGEAHGLDPEWLVDAQKHLPQPDLTVLLDIPPETSARRKTADRDAYERDLRMLARVRDSYLRQAASARAAASKAVSAETAAARAAGWIRLDADRDRDTVAAEVYAAVHEAVARTLSGPRGRA